MIFCSFWAHLPIFTLFEVRDVKQRFGAPLVRIRFNRRPTLQEGEILAARRRSFEVEGGGDKEDEGGENKGEASKWRQRKTMFR